MSTAIVLGSPPEFGRDGSWPPVSSQAVVVSTKTFAIGEDAPDPSHIPSTTTRTTTAKSGGGSASALAGASGAMAGAVVLGPIGFVLGAGLVAAVARRKRQHRRIEPERESEVRMLIYSQLWRRDDPIVQLPPGTTQEKTYTVTTGIERSHTRELSRSLGLKTGDALALSASLATRFGTQITLKAQESRTDTLRLQNDGAESYRRFARWSVIHRLEVVSLGDPARRGGPPVANVRSIRDRAGTHRLVLVSVEIPDANSANLTAVDIDPSKD